MKCEICGVDNPDPVYLLPLHREDGKLDTTACEKCAKKSEAWCEKHQRIHQGFADGTTACLVCINNIVEKEMIIHGDWQIYHDVMKALVGEDVYILEEALQMSVEAGSTDKAVALLRFIASKAVRTGSSFEEITRRLMAEQSVAYLFSVTTLQ